MTDLQHQMTLLTLGNKLHLCPLPEKIHRAIDIATGTGIWVIDFAEAHPEAHVRYLRPQKLAELTNLGNRQ